MVEILSKFYPRVSGNSLSLASHVHSWWVSDMRYSNGPSVLTPSFSILIPALCFRRSCGSGVHVPDEAL